MTPALADALRGTLPPAAFRDAAPAYFEEPRGKWTGRGIVLAPGSTQEVAEVVRFAARHRVGIVPWSGGTGLVGGQVMPDGAAPIVLSLERMTRIRAVHADEGVLVAEAGAILADVQRAAEDTGRLFPLSLASEGSARIGGLLATNAGGVNVLRYGNARDLVLGVEAVLPDGSILHGARRLRKDNTGYDLRHLLIGAEGTLGVITAASLRLVPRPAVTGAAIMAVTDPAAALRLLGLAQAAGGISAFELISGQALRLLDEAGLDLRQPFAEVPDWCVLVDIGLPKGGDPPAVLEALFVAGSEDGLVTDGVIAASDAQRAAFWSLREGIPEANRRIGAIVSNDVSLPLSEVAGFVAEAPGRVERAAGGSVRINAFGHLGDGNLHYNVFPPSGAAASDYRDRAVAISGEIEEIVARRGGSFSAEHGVGRAKVGLLERYGDPAKLAAMHAIKAALDPAGIMNPGAVLRAPTG